MNNGIKCCTHSYLAECFNHVLPLLNTGWIAVVACVLISHVPLSTAPRSVICIILTISAGVYMFYIRRKALDGLHTVARDLFMSAVTMSAFYSNFWAFKILLGVVMISFAGAQS